MKAFWICSALLSMVAAIPLQNTNIEEILRNDNPSALESIILNLIEDLRETIYNGSEDLPVLDPLYIDELTLTDEDVPLPGAHLQLKDTTVQNLGSFVVDEISVSSLLIINRVHLSGYIPVIDVDNGHYDLSVSVAGYSVFGAGRSRLKIINPRITADLTIQLGIISGMTLTQCDVKFNLGAFEPEISGLFGHEGASEFVNWFLQDLVPELVIFYETEINDFLSDVVRDIVSDALP